MNDAADWKTLERSVDSTVRRSKATVVGASRINHAQHGLLVNTALRAFGDNSKATFFIEGLLPKGDIPRPDLIILHPEIGILVIENKGVRFEDIHDVHDSSMTLVRDGKLKQEDAFQQAERVMFLRAKQV